MRRPAVAIAVLAAMHLGSAAGEAATTLRPSGPNRDQPVLFVADEIQQDEQLGLVVAKGHVEFSQKDQTLLADIVTYNQRTNLVTASGHVSLLDPSGSVVFGDYMELTDDMRDGFIQNVRALLSDRSRVAGNTGRRTDGNVTEIRRGVYSPCDLCAQHPTAPPLWQLKAARMVHDQARQVVEFYDATMEIYGVPIAYSPYLSAPDPSVKRKTGFLAPDFGHSSSIGDFFRVPYYIVLDTDKDLTLEPIITTDAGALISGQYRQRWGYGRIRIDASAAYTNRTNALNDQPISPIDAFRGHFFANGEFDISDNWRTSFDVQRSSDQTYTRRFGFGGTQAYLESRAYAEGFNDRSYTLIDSYIFQSLRFGIGDSTQPIVLPTATYNWISHPDSWGGRWDVTANALNLFRPNGAQIRRVSAGANWEVPFDGAIGDRFNLTAGVRGDAYDSDNVMLSPSQPGANAEFTGRVFPQAKLEWRYPWVRQGNGSSQTIEPIVAFIAAPNGGNPAQIPAEDSTGVEFDDASLFVLDRFPGYDRVDSGQRVDYALSGGIYGDHGGSTRFLVGESYRLEKNGPFLRGSGLNTQRSDVVGRISVSPQPYLDLVYRFRLDSRTLASRRQEIDATGGPQSLRMKVGYIDITQDPLVPDLQKRRQITGQAVAALTRYWSVAVFGTRALGTSANTLNSGIATTYRDECVTFSAAVTHVGIRDRDVRPGTTVLFSIIFKNLGEIDLTPLSTGSSFPAPVF
ncbi:MAG TPA: LPS assembly protein LptD [Stellaceae bacterium]|nr:LPS assembly protein LptD [Stellaceae bacterium]